MAKKQIINPLVGFGQRSIGPYANRIGAATYARHVGLGDFEPPVVATLYAFAADGQGTLKGLVTGTGSMAFARASDASVTDFEGLVKTALANELRFEYGRGVENFVPGSEDLTDATWSWNAKVNCTATAEAGYTEITGVGGVGNLSKWIDQTATEASRDFTNSIELLLVSGSDSGMIFRAPNGLSHLDLSGLLSTTTWRRFSVNTSPNSSFGAQFGLTGFADGVTFWAREAQNEETSGQANKNPSEPVSVGVLSYPYHGVGVDGVAYFSYENGNTVDGNGVVTESQGAAITDWGALFEPASTNYSNTTNDLTGGAETVDLTTPGTGDYTLSVKGSASVTVAAGTAVGTGFGIATDGNNIKFNLSTAGTVTLTLNSGTLSQTQSGKYRKQVEKLAVETSLIETSGTAVTRTVDNGSAMFDINGNVDLTKGSMVVDLQWNSDYNDLSQANEALIAFTDIANNFLYYASDEGSIYSNDGTNACKISLSFVAGKTYRIGLTWSVDNGINISFKNVTDSGSWQPWANTSFDGAYEGEQTGKIRVAYPNLLYRPTRFRDLRFWLQDIGTQFIEDSY